MKQKHIGKFILRMQFTGYDPKHEVQVYRGGRKRLDTIICNETSGTSPRYRNKYWNRIQRVCDKSNRGNTLYKTDKYKEGIIVEVIAHRELSRGVRKALKEAKLDTKVVENPGSSIRSQFTLDVPL